MTNTLLTLGLVTAVTLLGDFLLKTATTKPAGMMSGWFAGGALCYVLLAAGWYLLMKNNSLATIGVMFSASTIILLAALGYFAFKEQFGLREALGVSLAILAVVVMGSR